MSTANAKEKAVRVAVEMLKAAGAQFAVTYEGQTYGELKIVAPPTRINWNAKYGHVKLLKAMKVNDELLFNCDEEDVAAMLSTIRGMMISNFGSKSYIIDAKETTIAVLRINNTFNEAEAA